MTLEAGKTTAESGTVSPAHDLSPAERGAAAGLQSAFAAQYLQLPADMAPYSPVGNPRHPLESPAEAEGLREMKFGEEAESISLPAGQVEAVHQRFFRAGNQEIMARPIPTETGEKTGMDPVQ